MASYAFVFELIRGATVGAVTTPLSIVLGTFIWEDAATVVVGVLAADHLVSISVALASLTAGIIVGDLVLYIVGRLAITHPTLRKLVEHERVAPVGDLLHDKLTTMIVTARFLPGLRFPTYLACGFFNVPFKRFALTDLAALIVWTPLLFTISYLFGVYTLTWLGIWRWPLGIVVVGILILVGRKHWNDITRERS